MYKLRKLKKSAFVSQKCNKGLCSVQILICRRFTILYSCYLHGINKQKRST